MVRARYAPLEIVGDPSTYVLIHGGGGSAWDWHLVAPELRARGHDVVAVDLPTEDESAGLWDYADAVVEAVAEATRLVVVGHSLGGFTAPLVCARVPVDLLVLVAAMVPAPGENASEWWAETGHAQAFREQSDHDGSDDAVYYHDVPAELAAEAKRRERGQTEAAMVEPWPLEAWPDVPTRFLLCRGDRMFPAEWMRRIVGERLGVVPDEMDGGHYISLSRPRELADRLERYRAELG
jgi:pimeloyl-ACP methyl ester carboxylesterase